MSERSALEREIDRVDAMTRAGQVQAEDEKAFADDGRLRARMDRELERGHIHTSYGSK